MDDSAAVIGTRRSFKEMVDGTLRVQIDIEPQHKSLFFRLFTEIDTKVVLARLADAAFTPASQATEEAEAKTHQRREGQKLSEYAAFLCTQPLFQEWARDELSSCWPPAAASLEEAAAVCIRRYLAINSRAELDSNQMKASHFHSHVRERYFEWVHGRG